MKKKLIGTTAGGSTHRHDRLRRAECRFRDAAQVPGGGCADGSLRAGPDGQQGETTFKIAVLLHPAESDEDFNQQGGFQTGGGGYRRPY